MLIGIYGNDEEFFFENINPPRPPLHTSIVFLYFSTQLFHDPLIFFVGGDFLSNNVCAQLPHKERGKDEGFGLYFPWQHFQLQEFQIVVQNSIVQICIRTQLFKVFILESENLIFCWTFQSELSLAFDEVRLISILLLQFLPSLTYLLFLLLPVPFE